MTRVRPATPADAPQTITFIRQAMGDRETLEEDVRTLVRSSDTGLRIAVENGRVVGALGMSYDGEWAAQHVLNSGWKPLVRNNAVAFLCYGAVHENWRGRGIGSRLLSRTEADFRQATRAAAGVAWLHDGVDGGDLLETNGYVSLATITAYWDRLGIGSFSCQYCGQRCTCDVALYVKQFSGNTALP